MKNPEVTIDLDALFDSLNIEAAKPEKAIFVLPDGFASNCASNSIGICEFPIVGHDFFLFDPSSDQS